jgi:branched-chain amino acid transport system ATP-binding protein
VPEPLLDVQGLEVGYDGALLAPLSFSLARGRSILIYGPNGVGKSTILRTLFGLWRPLSGRIQWHYGSVPTTPRGLILSGVRLLGQGNRGFGQLRVDAQTHVLTRLYGLPPSARDVQSVDRRRVAELSFGQRRLAALLALEAGEPECLLLDEPLAGLDRSVTTDVVSTCERLVGNGSSLLLVEHRIAPLLQIIDDLIVIQGRRITYVGPAKDAALNLLGVKN